MFSDPSFWSALASVVFCAIFGVRLMRSTQALLEDRRLKIFSCLNLVDDLQKVAEEELEQAKQELEHAQALTRQWLKDAAIHAQEVEESTRILMQYRRKLADQNLELHLQDMRMRIHQELGYELLQCVGQKLQQRFDLEEDASLVSGLQKILH